jgi:pimeloyl-ACP methyl ester carboxylesterase
MRTHANGATLYHEEHGAGEPLVLIHGGLASSAMWEPLLPGLIDRFRVITPDSRGHGRSTNPGGTLSYAQLADDVAALIAAFGLERPVVGGYSDGGQIALEVPRAGETPAADFEEVDLVDALEPPTCRRVPAPLATMRTRAAKPRDDRVALGDELDDLHPEIGERRPERRDPPSRGASHRLGADLLQHAHVAGVDDILD